MCEHVESRKMAASGRMESGSCLCVCNRLVKQSRKRTKEVEVSGKTKKCNIMDTEVTVQKTEAGQRTLEETKRNMYIRLKN